MKSITIYERACHTVRSSHAGQYFTAKCVSRICIALLALFVFSNAKPLFGATANSYPPEAPQTSNSDSPTIQCGNSVFIHLLPKKLDFIDFGGLADDSGVKTGRVFSRKPLHLSRLSEVPESSFHMTGNYRHRLAGFEKSGQLDWEDLFFESFQNVDPVPPLIKGEGFLINAVNTLYTITNLHMLLTLSHENAHATYIIEHGGEVIDFAFHGISGKVSYSGHINAAGVSAAGIEREKMMADLYLRTLKLQKSPDQISALCVLYAKSTGVRYVLSSEMGWVENTGNDLLVYSESLGLDLNHVYAGLIADFLLDTDILSLLKLAAGKKTKLRPWQIKFFYNLEKKGPENEVRFSMLF